MALGIFLSQSAVCRQDQLGAAMTVLDLAVEDDILGGLSCQGGSEKGRDELWPRQSLRAVLDSPSG